MWQFENETLEVHDTNDIHSQFFPDWKNDLQKLQNYPKNTLEDNYIILRYTRLPPNIINYIFSICNKFKLKKSVAFLSVDIFKIFVHKHFFELNDYAQTSDNLTAADSHRWNMLVGRVSQQMQLRMLSCIQLAYKSDKNYPGLKCSRIMHFLSTHANQEYDKKAIMASEFRVFRSIGFKIPMWTFVSIVELLVTLTITSGVIDNTQEDFLSVCYNVLELVYVQESTLYDRMISTISPSPHVHHANDGKVLSSSVRAILGDNDLLISAAVILCAGRLMCCSDVEQNILLESVAEEADLPTQDIWTVSAILFVLALGEDMT